MFMLICINTGAAPQGGGGGGKRPPQLIMRVWGCDVTNHIWISSEFVTSDFQRPDLTYILSNC